MSSLECDRQGLNSNEIFIQSYFDHLAKFQYEKAKYHLEKHKDTYRIWSLLQSALLNLINGEKFYHNLLFLNLKSITRIGDRYFEPVISLLEQITRELTSMKSPGNIPHENFVNFPNIFDVQRMPELGNQIISFVNFRFEMMAMYFELKERACRQERGFTDYSIKQLNDIEEKFVNQFSHPIMEPIKCLYEIEIGIFKNLLTCHQSIDQKLDCVKSIISIKEMNEIFSKLPPINSKLSKESKSFSLFSRSGSQSRPTPPLYQWFKMYYQCLLNKFSLINHDSFYLISDISHILKEKIDVYPKIVAFVNKFSPSLTGILLEALPGGIACSRGFGYEMASSLIGTRLGQNNDGYAIVFTYPRNAQDKIDKHFNVMPTFLSTDLDQKVKYFSDQTLKSTYYLAKISENYVFFMVFELNRQENKLKTSSFVQEIADELSFNNVFSIFNPNLR